MNIQLRTGVAEDAAAIHALIAANLSVGHLLPRTFDDVESHVDRFVVAVKDEQVIGCGELAPLSGEVAEVRSLVVDEASRGQHAGVALVTALADRARELGYVTLCAFTHQPSHFVRLGFSIVPHVWVPEKIAHDCVGCSQFRHCGQYAVSLQLRAGAGLRLDLSAPPQRSVAQPRTSVERLRLLPRLGMTGPAVKADLVFATIDGSVSAPQGFRAAGVACGIKKSNGLDLALIVSDLPASSAAVFTTNKAVAAPVLVSKARLQASGGHSRVIAINSGCANACTGPDGHQTAEAMADAAAGAAGVAPSLALVASTGVIGVSLNRQRVTDGIAAAAKVLARDGGPASARAIMTTDPFPKEAAVEVTTAAGRFRVGGIAKGSGMIEPLMATMLGVVTTDAKIEPALLQRALTAVTEVTFNAITVDGECSTNDCVFALANGASGVTITASEFDLFVEAIRQVCEPLAIGIVRGGEGATKLITVEVTGGATDVEAKRAARAIANSPLVKTAVHGADPNWGRLVAVAGRAGVDFNLDRARVQIGDVELFAGGRPFDERAGQASDYLLNKEVTLRVDLGTGKSGAARMWTCDLSAEYVKINAEDPNMIAHATAATWRPTQFLSVLDLTPDELETCLDLAVSMKAARRAGRPHAMPLTGRHIALLFDKPSLRTRSTFMIAGRELGGDVIEPQADVALGGREAIEDVARNLERWVFGVVVRTFAQERLVRFAAAAPGLRVVNALTDEEHPCQALADCQTLVERWGSLRDRTIAFVGDGNNVAASLAQAAAMLGGTVIVASPRGFELPSTVLESVAKVARFGGGVRVTNDPVEAVSAAGAVYTDVWASMGQENEAASRDDVFRPYQVNAALMAQAPAGAVFMHCLPAHRGDEVTDEVMDSPASIVFDQSENRLHAQKALLALLAS